MTETPELVSRPDGASEHPSRCHFAEVRRVVTTEDLTGNEEHGLFEGQGLQDTTDAASAGQAGGGSSGGAGPDTSTAGA